jgi:hypothetical protein
MNPSVLKEREGFLFYGRLGNSNHETDRSESFQIYFCLRGITRRNFIRKTLDKPSEKCEVEVTLFTNSAIKYMWKGEAGLWQSIVVTGDMLVAEPRINGG